MSIDKTEICTVLSYLLPLYYLLLLPVAKLFVYPEFYQQQVFVTHLGFYVCFFSPNCKLNCFNAAFQAVYLDNPNSELKFIHLFNMAICLHLFSPTQLSS
jgi:hypothetical protein